MKCYFLKNYKNKVIAASPKVVLDLYCVMWFGRAPFDVMLTMQQNKQINWNRLTIQIVHIKFVPFVKNKSNLNVNVNVNQFILFHFLCRLYYLLKFLNINKVVNCTINYISLVFNNHEINRVTFRTTPTSCNVSVNGKLASLFTKKSCLELKK